MQELMDTDVAAILRDLVDFLENLAEVELPSDALPSTRENLLLRSRAALEQLRSSKSCESAYLDMKPGGRSLLILDDKRNREYMNVADSQQQRSSSHYYETFQDYHKEDSEATARNNGRSMDDVVQIYKSFSAAQAQARSAKFGSLLYLKREPKMFAPFNVLWPNKLCWVSLLGTHLLLYATERDSQPYEVIPLRGYKSRAAPNAIPRDPRRSETAFEIYCPGERTFQFLAKSQHEMKDWIDVVQECLQPEQAERAKNRAPTFVEILELESNERMCVERVKEEKEKYQDVFAVAKPKSKQSPSSSKSSTPREEKPNPATAATKEEAPPLPARTRRLPSIPSQERVSCGPCEETYDDEGLYHRIEDIRAQREYQNCQVRTSQEVDGVLAVQETYDDVEGVTRADEPYDDVHSVVRRRDEPISYDDVQAVAENATRQKPAIPATKPLKSPTKLSFLNRMIHRRESMKKDDRKAKAPTALTRAELPCYDDVSAKTREIAQQEEEENYLSPPPPRPIYSRPPTIIKCTEPDDIYDDIGTEVNGGCKGCANVDVIKDYPKNGSFLSDLQLSIDQEHYQVPKSGNRRVPLAHQQQDELYDDVKISESFKSRPVVASPEKSVWGRLGSGKRPRIFDHLSRSTSVDTADAGGDNAEDGSNASEQNGSGGRVKPIQKLINKMENTLGKVTKANGVA